MRIRKPTPYETLCALKAEVRELNMQVQVLEALEASELTVENLAEIKRISERARNITAQARAYAQKYGMAV